MRIKLTNSGVSIDGNAVWQASDKWALPNSRSILQLSELLFQGQPLFSWMLRYQSEIDKIVHSYWTPVSDCLVEH